MWPATGKANQLLLPLSPQTPNTSLPKDLLFSIPTSQEQESTNTAKRQRSPSVEVEGSKRLRVGLPSNFKPEAKDDNIRFILKPWARDDDVSEGSEEEADSGLDFDEIDYQNYEDYDPDQDSIEYESSDDRSTHSDKVESKALDGPISEQGLEVLQALDSETRLYERCRVSETESQIPGRCWDIDKGPLGMSTIWGVCQPISNYHTLDLAPYTLLIQIPIRCSLNTDENNAQFLRQVERYPQMTSLEEYRRFAAYQQNDPSYPRWLLVVEFDELEKISRHNTRWMQNLYYRRKKKEIKAWWRRQGFRGVKLNFYKLVETHAGDKAGKADQGSLIQEKT